MFDELKNIITNNRKKTWNNSTLINVSTRRKLSIKRLGNIQNISWTTLDEINFSDIEMAADAFSEQGSRCYSSRDSRGKWRNWTAWLTGAFGGDARGVTGSNGSGVTGGITSGTRNGVTSVVCSGESNEIA